MQDNVTVDIEVSARVGIDRDDMYEHKKEMQELKVMYDKEKKPMDCECWKEESTEKEVAECLAFALYLEETNMSDGRTSLDFSWHSGVARAPNLPLEIIPDDEE